MLTGEDEIPPLYLSWGDVEGGVTRWVGPNEQGAVWWVSYLGQIEARALENALVAVPPQTSPDTQKYALLRGVKRNRVEEP